MKKLLLSSVLLFSGLSISAAESDVVEGTTENMIKAIDKARQKKLIGPAMGGTYNIGMEKTLDEIKGLLEHGKRDEAVKKIREQLLFAQMNIYPRYSLGRTPGYHNNDMSALFRAILEGKPEVISSEITKPEGLTGRAGE